jgi:hypothetical protein
MIFLVSPVLFLHAIDPFAKHQDNQSPRRWNPSRRFANEFQSLVVAATAASKDASDFQLVPTVKMLSNRVPELRVPLHGTIACPNRH